MVFFSAFCLHPNAGSADSSDMSQTVRRLTVLTAALLTAVSTAVSAEPLRFRHEPGDTRRVVTDVRETVSVDGYPAGNVIILNRATLETEAVDGGVARIRGSFRTFEQALGIGGLWEWDRAEDVTFTRDDRGRLTVPDEAGMPVVRGVPSFPDREVKPGDSWTAPAEEVHSFRFPEGTAGPYRVPVNVIYEYLRDETVPVQTAVIGISYDIYHPVGSAGGPVRQFAGRSRQILHWDVTGGRPLYREESFRFDLGLADGRTITFEGTHETVYESVAGLDGRRTREALAEDLTSRGLTGVEAEERPDGVALVVDDVMFDPESARLRPEERARLEALRPLLDAYDDRDLLISGHTALAGTPEGRRRLSLERAAAVADLLFPEGRPGPGRMLLEGRGAADPQAGNEREAERARNRRVEILILKD